MPFPYTTSEKLNRGRGRGGPTRGRGGPYSSARGAGGGRGAGEGGRGRGRGGGSYATAVAAVTTAIAEAAMTGDAFETYLDEVCPHLVDLLSSADAPSTEHAAGKNDRVITYALKECGDAVLVDWQSHAQSFERLVRAAPRCCWQSQYCAFLNSAIRAAPPAVVDSLAVLEGIDVFCQKIPEARRNADSEVEEFCALISRLLARARANPQNIVQPRAYNQQAAPAFLYEQQIQQFQRVATVLDLLNMPTTEPFLFPLSSGSDGGDSIGRAAAAGMRDEMRRLPLVQTWHPIPVEQGWYHLLVQFLLLRADCASGLRNAVACVHEAFVNAAIKGGGGGAVQLTDVTRALHALCKNRDSASFVRPYWNATWVGVGFHGQYGLVYVVELEMPVASHKRLMNDNVVLLSKRYFDRQSPIHVGLIRSLPRDHLKQQEEALKRARGKTFKKRFAFEVIATLGPAVAFPTEAADSTQYCVVESPVLYSAYNASLLRLKEMLESAFSAVGNAAWPCNSGLPLEGALLAGHTNEPPAYMATCRTPLSVENAIAACRGVAPLVDAQDTQSWNWVCREWSEDEEKRVKQLAEEDASKKWCHVLDETQRAALSHIFSHRVALVQGTPGTGKSFVGFKFIQLVLENYRTLNPGPIVVTAVTNHALDAVLGEVLRYMEDTHTYEEGAILRLGRGSRANPEVEKKCDFEEFTRSASREVRAIEKGLEDEVQRCASSFYGRVTKVFPALPSHLRVIRNLTLQRLLPSFSGTGGFTEQTTRKLCEMLDAFTTKDSAPLNAERTAELVKLLSPMFKTVTAGNVTGLLEDLRNARPYLECSDSNVFHEWCRWDKHQPPTPPKKQTKWLKKQQAMSSAPPLSKLPELQKQMTLLSPPGSTAVPPQLAAAIRHARDVLKSERDVSNSMPLFRETDDEAGYADEELSEETDSDGGDAAAVADVRVTRVSDSGRAALDAALAAAKKHMNSVPSLLALSKDDRELLLDAVPDEGRKRLVKVVKEIAEDRSNAESLKRSNRQIASRIAEQMRRAKVVGGTVNALLKESKALALLKPRILLVEEAGQVLEGQLIASLSDGLEHLLLIGDHRQLPPQPEEYALDKKGLGVSLMERLVRSGAPYETLTTQRRMHPEVSQLIHGYYRRVDPSKPVQIEDHPSTYLRPPPQGVRDEMRTLMVSYNPEDDQTKQEHRNGDVGSYSNLYEADLCATMASHLAMYNPNKTIIVLSYYSDQRQQITKLMDPALLQSRVVKVRTVDDFQGEEEDFVIVSTVRTERPGFVNVENRACVALSRARMACYVVGCEAMLRESCGVFRDLMETLSARTPSCVLKSFPACCPMHHTSMPFCSKKERTVVACPEVCNLPVGPCGHLCKKRCHGPVHDGRCTVQVSEACPHCHQIRKFLCYEKTEDLLPPCATVCSVSGLFTLCGHRVQAPCHRVFDSSMPVEAKRRMLSVEYCRDDCRKVMPCGHVCPRKCHATIDVDHAFEQHQCKERVEVPHPGCGHPTSVLCSADRSNPNTYSPCRELCAKRFGCGHTCQSTCGHKGACVCREKVAVTLPCGHDFQQECCHLGMAHSCCEMCTHTHTRCGHPCSGVCGECTARGCHVPCERCAAQEADVYRQEAAIQLAAAALAKVQLALLARPNSSAGIPSHATTPAPPSRNAPVTSTPLPTNATSNEGTDVRSSAAPPRAPKDPTQQRPEAVGANAQPEASGMLRASAQRVGDAMLAAGQLPKFLTEASIGAFQRLVSDASGALASLVNKESCWKKYLELCTLKKTLCSQLNLRAASFTCDVDPETDWRGVDELSREAMKDVLPLLKGSTELKASSGEKALDLVDREFSEAACAPLLRALVYSSKTHIGDFKQDAAEYLREYVKRQQQSQEPLLMSLVLVVAGRVFGGPTNPALWSSCVCRARVDPEALQLLDPETENFTQPLDVGQHTGEAGVGGASATGKADRWAALNGMVSLEAMETARELESMIGLETVKRDVFQVCNTIIQQKRLPPKSCVPQTFNFVLQGNPGTGKTTVARLLGTLLHQMQVREKETFIETTGEKLARGGATAAAQLFDDAEGGVLFIDEAYALDPKKGGENSSIAMQLLQVAEDKREDLTIILAGYKDDLETKLFEFNDGFARRFPFVFSFEDYNDAELERIFRKYCGEFNWTPLGDAAPVAARRVGRGRGRKGFGNAGAVRVCFEAACRRATERTKGSSTELLCVDVMGPRPSRTTPPDLALALKELDDMIGLSSVKEKIMGMVSVAERNYDLELEGREPHFCTLNRVFLGNPGTGKTTVAKLYGRILKGLGWLSKGEWELRQPGDIIKGAVGQSEEAMGKLLTQCQGKLLIIDEAYQFHENKTYGAPAISTLVSKVHGEPGENIGVVLIGYQKEMDTMLRESNPGLKRRFDLANAFIFEDYSRDELERVMARLAEKKKVTLPPDLRRRVVKEIDKTRTSDNFGNAGVVTQAVASAMSRMLARDVNAQTLTLGDFGLDDAPPDVEGSLASLDGLYQVEHIKEYVRQLAAGIRQREADGESRSASVVNYVFTGSPGTGKTTVARAMGKMLKCLKCLETDKVVETSGQKMIGSYLGQTKDQVTKLMDNAEGGILFIDEAYSMCDSGPYGAEAVATLVELMTSGKHYRRTVVIVAGYTDSMDKLLQLNDGLRSRFTEKLHFPDWGVEDGVSFLRQCCAKERLQLVPEDAAVDFLRTALTSVVGRPGWGNARSCHTLMDELKNARAARLHGVPEKPKRVTLEDVMRACSKFTALFPSSNVSAAPQKPGHALAAATQEMAPVMSRVEETTETATADDAAPEEKAEQAVVEELATASSLGDEDPFFTALLAACKAAGYDSSHERRKELIAVLEAAQRGTRLPDVILQPVVRDTGKPAAVVMAALKPQIPTVLLGMRNAVQAQEAIDAQLALLAEEEKERKIREREALRKRLIALCPAGYQWFECGNGWRCGGGSHFVSNDQLPTIDV